MQIRAYDTLLATVFVFRSPESDFNALKRLAGMPASETKALDRLAAVSASKSNGLERLARRPASENNGLKRLTMVRGQAMHYAFSG